MKKIFSLIIFLSLLANVKAYGNDIDYNYCKNQDNACKVCVYGNGDSATDPFKYIVYLKYDGNDVTASYDKYSTYIEAMTEVSFDMEDSKFYKSDNLVCPEGIYSKLNSDNNTRSYNVTTKQKDNYETVQKTNEFANTTTTTDSATCVYRDAKTTVEVTFNNSEFTILVPVDGNEPVEDEIESTKRFFFNYCAITDDTIGLNTDPNTCISSIQYSNFRIGNSLNCPSQFIISHYETEAGTKSYVYGFSVDENYAKKSGKAPKINIFLNLDVSSSEIIEAETPKFSCQYQYGTSNKSTINLNIYENEITASYQAYDNTSREIMVEGIEYGNNCSSISAVYSNCLGVNVGEQCYVKRTKDSSQYYKYELTSTTTGDQLAGGSYQDGSMFLKLLMDLKTPLSGINNLFVINQKIKISGEDKTLGGIDYGYRLCDDKACGGNARYKIEEGTKKIASYCNDVYKLYANGKISKDRIEECASFNDYYKAMVNKGIINDLANDCGILSNDFLNLLRQLFTIIKIAGPIIAIFLGMIDFVKTVVSEDPEKEQKTAIKKFTKRIIAAILIFLVPTILTFLMNLFLSNEEGYNKDNPFCNITDMEVEE